MPRGGFRAGAGKKPKWKHGKTKPVRVPTALVDEVLRLVSLLDQGKKLEVLQNESVTVSKVIDLQGIQLKSVDGKIYVGLEGLVKKGYHLKPERLNSIVSRSVKSVEQLEICLK